MLLQEGSSRAFYTRIPEGSNELLANETWIEH